MLHADSNPSLVLESYEGKYHEYLLIQVLETRRIYYSYTLECSCMYLTKGDSETGPCLLMGSLAYCWLKI